LAGAIVTNSLDSFPLVISGGRVIDPETGFDAVADVGINGATVGAVSTTPLEGAQRIDATGLVVCPGFVDLHSHGQAIPEQRLQALDGVTTALELEAGITPVASAYARAAAEGRPLNYGYSTSWALARMAVLAGAPLDGPANTVITHLGNPAWQVDASPKERAAIFEHLSADLAAGALGIGVLAGYAPHLDPAEYLAVAELAAQAGLPTYTHARPLVEADPDVPIDGAEEIVRVAGQTGAHMHYCHVNSTSARQIDRVLGLVERCRLEGAMVTTEAYPYGAGSTAIGAAFLSPESLARQGIRTDTLVLVATGERIADAARLAEVRAADPGALAVLHFLDEDDPADRAHLDRSEAGPADLAAARRRARPSARRGHLRQGPAPPLPRDGEADAVRGDRALLARARAGAGRGRARHAAQGPPAPGDRRRHRGVRPRARHRPGVLRGRHPALARHPARPGQRRPGRPRRRDRAGRAAGPGRARLSRGRAQASQVTGIRGYRSPVPIRAQVR
jgi:hypothetical protein